MRRFFHLCGALMLVVMLWTGVSAHAAEALGCIEVSSAAAGHFDGDRDQTPSDGGKATPHHHSGCNGHHVATPSDDGPPPAVLPASPSLGDTVERVTTGADPGLALRPPIA